MYRNPLSEAAPTPPQVLRTSGKGTKCLSSAVPVSPEGLKTRIFFGGIGA